MTKGDLSAKNCGHKPESSETAVEQLDAHVGGRSRTDVGRRALRPTGDSLGHRSKGERTINKPGLLLKIRESKTSLGLTQLQPPKPAVKPRSICRSGSPAYHTAHLLRHPLNGDRQKSGRD